MSINDIPPNTNLLTIYIMANISNLAFVHPEAKLGENVTVEPFAFIDKNVVIGDNCHIRAHANILSGARIGKNNIFYEGCTISAEPQDFRWNGCDSETVIGDNNIIREQVIINRSNHCDGKTVIGSNTSIMAQTHIGHDSEIGDKCVIGNSVKIAGSCKIGNCTILSSCVVVHEKCHIGDWVLIKGGCRVNGHVPPFVIMAHNPISYFGINAYILGKGGYSEESITNIAKCYRHIYQSNTSVFNAMRRIREDVEDCPERKAVEDFVEGHDRIIVGTARE